MDHYVNLLLKERDGPTCPILIGVLVELNLLFEDLKELFWLDAYGLSITNEQSEIKKYMKVTWVYFCNGSNSFT